MRCVQRRCLDPKVFMTSGHWTIKSNWDDTKISWSGPILFDLNMFSQGDNPYKFQQLCALIHMLFRSVSLFLCIPNAHVIGESNHRTMIPKPHVYVNCKHMNCANLLFTVRIWTLSFIQRRCSIALEGHIVSNVEKWNGDEWLRKHDLAVQMPQKPRQMYRGIECCSVKALQQRWNFEHSSKWNRHANVRHPSSLRHIQHLASVQTWHEPSQSDLNQGIIFMFLRVFEQVFAPPI